MGNRDIEALLDEMTLEEQVSLLAGADFWTTVPIEAVMAAESSPASLNAPVLHAVEASFTVTVVLSTDNIGAKLVTTSSKLVVVAAPSESVAVMVTTWLIGPSAGV